MAKANKTLDNPKKIILERTNTTITKKTTKKSNNTKKAIQRMRTKANTKNSSKPSSKRNRRDPSKLTMWSFKKSKPLF
jgi:hypothetical protein